MAELRQEGNAMNPMFVLQLRPAIADACLALMSAMCRPAFQGGE
jgi:hypothetical protein